MKNRLTILLVDATLLFWCGLAFTWITDIQIGIGYPDSKYVTVINQIDKEKEIELTMIQQEKDSKKKG